MKKVSSQFRRGMEGEVEAWTWLGTVLKLTGLSDTMQEWDHEMVPFSEAKDTHIFIRKESDGK